MLVKELRELVKSYKILFVPLVFAILGIGQPVMMKMLPRLIDTASNMPPGTVIQIPVPTPGEVMAGVLAQYNQIGMLILALVCMGAVAGERNSGAAATVLTKPVGRGSYLAAKAVSFGLLATFSLLLGMVGAAYYTQFLIGPVSWTGVMQSTLIYLPNLWLAVSMTLAFSCFLPSPAASAGAGLAATLVLNLAPKYMGRFLAGAHPGALTESAGKALLGAEFAFAQPFIGVMVLVLAGLLVGWFMLERQEI